MESSGAEDQGLQELVPYRRSARGFDALMRGCASDSGQNSKSFISV